MLALTDGHGDNPLLIAAGKGSHDTLKFLMCCGIDIHSHRTKEEKVTAICLAWNEKHYENVQALLEVDSLFPYKFDLNKL